LLLENQDNFDSKINFLIKSKFFTFEELAFIMYSMKYYTFFLLLSFYSNLFAQKGNWSFYFNSGANYSNYHVTDTSVFSVKHGSTKTSYRYGIGLKYNLTQHFRIGTEINIEEKGWLTKNDVVLDTTLGKIVRGSRNYYYPYISFPLIIDYSLKIKKVKLLIEGGYLINVRRQGGTIKTDIKGTVGTIASLIQPYHAPLFDYGWMYGGGIEMDLKPNMSISLLGRYAQSYTGVATWGLGKDYYRHHNYAALLQLSYKIR
jgi:Outer membrane protein beta-barrel domain